MSVTLYPYNSASAGAKELAKQLGIKMIKREGSKFVGATKKLVINWGNSQINDEIQKCTILNKPEAVGLATNKLTFFNHIDRYNADRVPGQLAVKTVPSTDSRDTALDWIEAGYTVVARRVLNGSSGEGIVIADTREELPEARLYTRYVPKKAEYRVHVMNSTIIDVQRKARRNDWPDDQINWKVRNLAGGFIFVRNPESLGTVPADVYTQAINVISALDLDFGAVDILWNESTRRAYVLEVNTAPGLEGTTLLNYERYLHEFYGNYFSE